MGITSWERTKLHILPLAGVVVVAFYTSKKKFSQAHTDWEHRRDSNTWSGAVDNSNTIIINITEGLNSVHIRAIIILVKFSNRF